MRLWLEVFNYENRNDLETWAAAALLSACAPAEITYQAIKVHF